MTGSGQFFNNLLIVFHSRTVFPQVRRAVKNQEGMLQTFQDFHSAGEIGNGKDQIGFL